PFCGHRVVEGLAGIDTDLVDPFLPKFIEQQPDAAQINWQCAMIDTMAETLGL
ncbi:MAG TPA: class II histone deacetylase, partial [Alphaproteobacteria bacterium]|nr:class II histone deacetylase [Alphaproteobacteria bacterium]